MKNVLFGVLEIDEQMHVSCSVALSKNFVQIELKKMSIILEHT